MKKMITTLMIAVFVMVAGSAFAGPIDWAAEKLGYVPVQQLIASQNQTAEAIAVAKAAVAKSETAAKDAAAAKAAANTSFNVSALLTFLLGGFAVFTNRKKISDILNKYASKILEKKPNVEPKEV